VTCDLVQGNPPALAQSQPLNRLRQLKRANVTSCTLRPGRPPLVAGEVLLISVTGAAQLVLIPPPSEPTLSGQLTAGIELSTPLLLLRRSR